tara:strand:+ start:174 stop:779 length:606 start_codon:yes stop_codon:yes gene_type:complete
MPNPNRTEIITVLGQSGTGKSSWIEKYLPKLPRFILWDTLGEYSGFDIVETKEDLFNKVTKHEKKFFGVIFRFIGDDDKQIDSLNFMCRLAGAIEHCWIIIDEVDMYASPTLGMPEDLSMILKRGRHLGVSMLFASRRPAEVHRLITAQSRRFVLFRSKEDRDVTFLRGHVGDVADEMKKLPDLHYIDWNHGKTEKGEIKW